MGVADTLLTGALLIGGGYILIWHLLPAIQPSYQPFAPDPFGQFLPSEATPPAPAPAPGPAPASTAPATGTRCWPVGDGTHACACAGKPYTVMGKLRPCDDCYQMCSGGGLPDRGRPTNNPVPPRQVNAGLNKCTAQQVMVPNCWRNTACQYCWYSTGTDRKQHSACTSTQSCTAARNQWISMWGAKPAIPAPAPKPKRYQTKCKCGVGGYITIPGDCNSCKAFCARNKYTAQCLGTIAV